MNKYIWILDDDYSICDALKVVLEDVGYRVRRFDKGKIMLDTLKIEQPDLVLMDVLLTDESGLDIAQQIKKSKKYNHLPLIIMSANAVEKDAIQTSQAKAFLRKPFDIYDLVDLVNKYS